MKCGKFFSYALVHSPIQTGNTKKKIKIKIKDIYKTKYKMYIVNFKWKVHIYPPKNVTTKQWKGNIIF